MFYDAVFLQSPCHKLYWRRVFCKKKFGSFNAASQLLFSSNIHNLYALLSLYSLMSCLFLLFSPELCVISFLFEDIRIAAIFLNGPKELAGTYAELWHKGKSSFP